MEKKTEKAIRILIYTIVTIMGCSAIIAFLFPFIITALLGNFNKNTSKTLHNNTPKVETSIPIQQRKEVEKKPESRIVMPQNYKGTIYSWTNKEGKKTFSNVGFPKGETYTDPKIELSQ